MQVDAGADRTMISSGIWEKLGGTSLDGTARTLQADNRHKLYYKLYFKETAKCHLIYCAIEQGFPTTWTQSLSNPVFDTWAFRDIADI